MLKLAKLLILLGFSINYAAAEAARADRLPEYYKLQTVEIRSLGVGEQAVGAQAQSRALAPFDAEGSETSESPGVPDSGISPEQIVNLGLKVWKIISDNKPVITESIQSANALPMGISSWEQMASWQPPKSSRYMIVYKDLAGIEVVKFTYAVEYLYGGSYQGEGKYLANVQIVPVNLSVDWGFSFDAKVTVPSVVNVGRSGGEPVAGVEIVIDWTVKSVVSAVENSATYFVQGDGTLGQL